MINSVDFVSSTRIEAMPGDTALAVISITDPGSSDTRISPAFGPVLRMKFDDLDADSLASGSTGRVFAHGDAERVVSFLDVVDRDAGLDGVIVHCEMGRSRSGAIACIAGGLAEALYGIPAPLVEESQSYLPGAFLEVLQRLYAAADQPMPLAGSIKALPKLPSHHGSASIMDWINAFFI